MLSIISSSLNVKLNRKHSYQRSLWLLPSTKVSLAGLPFLSLKVIRSAVVTILFISTIWRSGYIYKCSLAKVISSWPENLTWGGMWTSLNSSVVTYQIHCIFASAFCEETVFNFESRNFFHQEFFFFTKNPDLLN